MSYEAGINEAAATRAEEVKKQDLDYYIKNMWCLGPITIILTIKLILIVSGYVDAKYYEHIMIFLTLAALYTCFGYYAGKYVLVTRIDDEIVAFLRKSL